MVTGDLVFPVRIVLLGLKIPVRILLNLLSLLLLGLGFWAAYRPRKAGAGAACSMASRRLARLGLWGSAALWTGAVLIQVLADRFWL